MQDLVDELPKPGELVGDLFFSTLTTAKACLKLSHHRLFVDCEADFECLSAIMEAIVAIHVTKALNKKSDFSDTDEMVDVCKIVV